MTEMPPQRIRALLRFHDRDPSGCPLPSLWRKEITWLVKKRHPNLSIETKENRVAVRGEKQTNDGEKTGDVLYQGIAARTGNPKPRCALRASFHAGGGHGSSTSSHG